MASMIRDMRGVYELLHLDAQIPPIHHGLADPKTAFAALKTLWG